MNKLQKKLEIRFNYGKSLPVNKRYDYFYALADECVNAASIYRSCDDGVNAIICDRAVSKADRLAGQYA